MERVQYGNHWFARTNPDDRCRRDRWHRWKCHAHRTRIEEYRRGIVYEQRGDLPKPDGGFASAKYSLSPFSGSYYGLNDFARFADELRNRTRRRNAVNTRPIQVHDRSGWSR